MTYGREELVEQTSLKVQPLCQRSLVRYTPSERDCQKRRSKHGPPQPRSDPGLRLTGVDRLLARLHRDGALLGDRARDLDGLCDDVALDDARDESPVGRLLCADGLARQDELHRARLADRLRQTLRAAGAGDDAELRTSRVEYKDQQELVGWEISLR